MMKRTRAQQLHGQQVNMHKELSEASLDTSYSPAQLDQIDKALKANRDLVRALAKLKELGRDG